MTFSQLDEIEKQLIAIKLSCKEIRKHVSLVRRGLLAKKIRICHTDHGDIQMLDGESEEAAQDRARMIWELGGYLK